MLRSGVWRFAEVVIVVDRKPGQSQDASALKRLSSPVSRAFWLEAAGCCC
jgi:hypothetical protein